MGEKTTITIENKEQYEQLIMEKDPVILYFSSLNCNVCQAVFPKLMTLVNDYSIPVAKINVDEQLEIAGQSLVFTVPTILIMYEGKEVLRESRFIDFSNIARTLEFVFCNNIQ
ncbi:hypothetical protein SDC9_206109 [bioreactor metagenome]|uniref:Thioredoxin domain-containing protein n=1 Tax=bioreactor metagenome TaxID=1076179 RepID=A0A645JDC0_9ZZZZ